MAKMNLPVLLIDNILLPNNTIKLDFVLEIDKTMIDESLLFHDKKILLAKKRVLSDNSIDINNLSNIGVVAIISQNIELPNGSVRVTLKGLNRALVHEYLYQNGTVESIASVISEDRLEPEIEKALREKLKKEFKSYTEYPNVSNSVLAEVNNIDNLNVLTDKIAYRLNLSDERLNMYLMCYNGLKRTELALEDIYKLKELYNIDNKIDGKVKKILDKTQKEFYLKEKLRIINEELGESENRKDEISLLYDKLNKLIISKTSKDEIKQVIEHYKILNDNSPEVSIYKNYIDLLLSLPWDLSTKSDVSLSDVKKYLDNTHFGLEEAKMRIVEHLAVQKKTKKNKGSIICLVGPSGVGKTTLAYSIASSIKRNFTKISVGGINDVSEILGHRQTYLGASAGRIIEGMKNAKSSNPVFLIDEIDKMEKGYNGDPAAALLEVLDSKQNNTFKDNYLNMSYDLSKVMFILTANDEENIPAALKDRLEIIYINSYTNSEKIEIARNYLIPKISEEFKMHLIFKDEVIKQIINNYTKEAGVRELEKVLRKIFRKVITNIVLNNLKEDTIKIEARDLKEYLGNQHNFSATYLNWNNYGIVNSLAVSNIGGIVLPIEVIKMPGTGKLVMSGLLSDTMKECIELSLDYIKSNYKYFKIDYKMFNDNDIHVHIPSGIKKDGISAGIAITLAIISCLKEKKIINNFALTGEMTLTGRVMPVSGIKEKCFQAQLNNINNIVLSSYNALDINNIDKKIKNKLNIKYVTDFKEIYDYVLANNIFE